MANLPRRDYLICKRCAYFTHQLMNIPEPILYRMELTCGCGNEVPLVLLVSSDNPSNASCVKQKDSFGNVRSHRERPLYGYEAFYIVGDFDVETRRLIDGDITWSSRLMGIGERTFNTRDGGNWFFHQDGHADDEDGDGDEPDEHGDEADPAAVGDEGGDGVGDGNQLPGGGEWRQDVCVYGPITQSQFLGNVGINFRMEALLQNCTEGQGESLRTALAVSRRR
ncbi:hypothetical protein LXL04_026225 [Taraxacum kok-saghyz]